MKVEILHLIEGAQNARGITVIIDVFRAFTVEAFFAQNNAQRIIPVSSIQEAFAYRDAHPGTLLCGEREGVMVEGFDFGNSPSQIEPLDFTGKTVVHTTSAGTQGIANAINAEEIIGGSLVTAKAIATYIKKKNPAYVSLVCMGLGGKKQTDEDTLCAKYIKSLLENNTIRNLHHHIARLKYTDGAKFFDPAQQTVFPERDFHLSVAYDTFDFVLRLVHDPETGISYMERVNVAPEEIVLPPTPVHPGDKLSQFTREEVILFPPEIKGAISYGTYHEPEGNFHGALVLGGNPTVLESRAEAAAKLYHQGRCDLFFPTGGVKWETEFGFTSEAETLCRYMVQMGVPREKIVCEGQATTTKENMQCCRELLQKKMELSQVRLAVVTSTYHIRRSVLLSKFYIPEAQHFGVAAHFPGDDPEHWQNDPRLVAAINTECVCLLSNIKTGQTEDFTIL